MTQIVIDLGKVWTSEQTVADAIVQQAVKSLLDSYDLRQEVQRRVAALTDAEISEAIKPLIAAALEKPYQPTNAYGDKVGEPTALREVIVRRIESELKQSASRDGFSSSSKRETLLAQIIGREINKVVGEDLRDAMNEARKQVHAAVEAKGAEILAETIARMAR